MRKKSMPQLFLHRIFSNKTECLFKTASDEFFQNKAEEYSGYFDVVLIDGLHTYEQVLRDVCNALKFLAPSGVIVMHDCNPSSAAMAYPAASYEAAIGLKLPGWDGLWCGDVWKSIVHLRSTRQDLNVCVIDCDFGVGIVKRGTPENRLNFPVKRIQSMTYEDLNQDRKNLLNLKPPLEASL
jgi:hypothetical protein